MRVLLLPVFLAGVPVLAPCQSNPATVPAGFAASIAFSERPQAFLVRGHAWDAGHDHHYLARRRELWRRPDPTTWQPVLQLHAPEEIGCLTRPAGQQRIWVTALRSGLVYAFRCRQRLRPRRRTRR
jgi:hypothetical protein